jgi:hypothetical protein
MIEIKQYRLTPWAKMGLREANPGEEDNLCYAEDAIGFHKKILREKQIELNALASKNISLDTDLALLKVDYKGLDDKVSVLKVFLTFSLVSNICFVIAIIQHWV